MHQVQSLEDIVQMFCDIYDLQNRFRDGALINQGEFALASHIEGDPKLRRQFHLSRSEYDQLTADEQKKKREKFCALQAPQLTKSKNKKLVVATDGLMSAPIHRFGGKKPSKGQRPTGSRVTVTKGGNKNKQHFVRDSRLRLLSINHLDLKLSHRNLNNHQRFIKVI